MYLNGYDKGFSKGFFLQYEGERVSQVSPNLNSALDNPTIVQHKLAKEIELGRIKGPYQSIPICLT